MRRRSARGAGGLAFEVEDNEVVFRAENLAEVVITVDADALALFFGSGGGGGGDGVGTGEEFDAAAEEGGGIVRGEIGEGGHPARRASRVRWIWVSMRLASEERSSGVKGSAAKAGSAVGVARAR